ncbi:MAG: type IV pili methyl-accepting chemotaxis transducer N-terminal domain-containing protein, partial [Magnetospirillum sp. WYHS-4]
MHERLIKGLTIRYAAMLGVLAALMVGGYLLMDGVIASDTRAGAQINTAGRQRMLSQRIQILAHDFAHYVGEHGDREGAAALRQDLLAAADQMERSHRALTVGDPAFGFVPELSREIRSFYRGPTAQLDADVRAFVGHVRSLAWAPLSAVNDDNPHLLHIMASASGPLLERLDQVVALLQKESESGTEKLRVAHVWVLVATLGVLALSAIALFDPMINQIRQAFRDRERADERILRSLTEQEIIAGLLRVSVETLPVEETLRRALALV